MSEFLTSPIARDPWLEEQRLKYIGCPDFVSREHAREAGRNPQWAGPDTLEVTTLSIHQGERTEKRRCLVDQQGCVVTSDQLRELIAIASEAFELLPDEDLEQYNLNQRERRFMGWIEQNSGQPYEEHVAGIRPKRVPRVHKPQPGYVYVVEGGGYYKIGKAKDIRNRTTWFELKLPFEVKLVYLIESEYYSETEKELHLAFANKRINGEWFDLTEEDLDYIMRTYTNADTPSAPQAVRKLKGGSLVGERRTCGAAQW